MRFADCTALVTGSSHGIGAAIVRELAGRGVSIVVHGRDTDAMDALAAELGGRAIAVDLLEPAGPELLAEKVGRVDLLVHCAGVGRAGEFTGMRAEDIERLVALNLIAPIRITRALLPDMVQAGIGHVAFIGSIAGLTGVPGESVYSASKAGLLTFADSLRLELSSSGVVVSTICPAAVDTGFWVERGEPYDRRIPAMVSPVRIAKLTVDDIERGHPRRIVPHWLGLAPALPGLAPSLYQRLAARFG